MTVTSEHNLLVDRCLVSLIDGMSVSEVGGAHEGVRIPEGSLLWRDLSPHMLVWNECTPIAVP